MKNKFMGEEFKSAFVFHSSLLSLSILIVSVAPVLFSHDSALLVTDDVPGLSMGPSRTSSNTLSPILVDFSRNGNIIHAGSMSTSCGFLDLKPRTSYFSGS